MTISAALPLECSRRASHSRL